MSPAVQVQLARGLDFDYSVSFCQCLAFKCLVSRRLGSTIELDLVPGLSVSMTFE